MKIKNNQYLFTLKVFCTVTLLILFLAGYFLTTKEISSKSLEFTNQQPPQDLIFNKYIILKGEVKNPGIYEFNNHEKLSVVINRAGGLTKEIESFNSLDLERELTFEKDGGKEFVIFSSNSSLGSEPNLNTELININTASKDELEKLPGIGSSTADSIINSRPFSKIEGLLNVKGIGEKKYEQIKDLVSL